MRHPDAPVAFATEVDCPVATFTVTLPVAPALIDMLAGLKVQLV
jgi:hypothetical protein